MSTSVEAIQALLLARNANYVSAVRLVSETNTVILDVPRTMVGDTVSPGLTSRRQLARLAAEITRQFGLAVIIAFRTGELLANIEAGLRATLQRRFPEALSMLAMSFPTSSHADVWTFLGDQATETEVNSVREAIEEYLRDARFSSFHVEVALPDRPSPTLMAILRSVKILAPVELGTLMDALREQGFRCPNERWLSAKLDMARKRDLVVRTPLGQYLLTIEGLSAVPVSRRRNSSDIDRILALGRKKKW